MKFIGKLFRGVPQEAHPVRIGRCASDLWLWACWALRVVQVVGGHVVRCAVVSGRVARSIGGRSAVGGFQFARCVQD